jgi:hypothetical protein
MRIADFNLDARLPLTKVSALPQDLPPASA